jgi:ribonuclease HI
LYFPEYFRGMAYTPVFSSVYHWERFVQQFFGLSVPAQPRPRPIFMVSTGRTGTQFFGRAFNALPGIMATHEPRPDFLDLAMRYARGQCSTHQAEQTLRQKRGALLREAQRQHCTHYLESNNRFFALLAPLRRVFPEALLVHVVRDGREYVRSGMSRPWYTEQDQELRRGRRLRALDFPDDPWHQAWNTLSRFEKICWRWQKKDNLIASALEEDPLAITIRFETLFDHSQEAGFRRLWDFLGLPPNVDPAPLEAARSAPANATAQYTFPAWPEWSAEQKRQFDRIAGPQMQRYWGGNYW